MTSKQGTGRHTAQPHGRLLGLGVLRLFIGRGLSLALSFVGWTLMARALGPAPFGHLQLLLAIFAYIAFAADPGLTTLGTREYVKASRPEQVVARILGTRVALAAGVVALVTAFALTADVTRDERIVFVVLGTGQIALALNVNWVLRAQMRSSALAAVEVASAATLGLGAWALVNGPGDFKSAAAVAVAGPWLAALITLFLVGEEEWRWPRMSWGDLRLLRRALPLGVAGVAIAIYYSVDTVLLGVFRGNEEVGWYAAAYRLVLPWLTLASVVGWLAMPKLAELTHRQAEAVAGVLRTLSRGMLLIALPLAVCTSLLAPLVVETIFGDAYLASAAPLALLIWTTVAVFANAPLGFLMLATERDRAYMRISVAGAVTNVVANLVLIPTMGMIGAAIARLLTEGLILVSILWMTRAYSSAVLLAGLRASIPVAIVSGVAVLPLRNSLAAIPVAVAAFAVSVVLTRAIPPASLRRLATGLGGAGRASS